MMAPSTMLSGGTVSTPRAETRNPLPTGLSSMALTELDPMSRPTIFFVRRNSCTLGCLPTIHLGKPNTSVGLACRFNNFGPEYRNWRFRAARRCPKKLQKRTPLTFLVPAFGGFLGVSPALGYIGEVGELYSFELGVG